MKRENEYSYFRDFFDLIPEPLAIIDKKTFKIYFVNQEFQHFLKKSFSSIKNTHLNELFSNDLFFLSNLNETSKKLGVYLIREALVKDNLKFSVLCIVTEKKNQNMMIILILNVLYLNTSCIFSELLFLSTSLLDILEIELITLLILLHSSFIIFNSSES